jgi:D-3-phosphoglycerate dehydrogenase / 2-oxoglutarate reductase
MCPGVKILVTPRSLTRDGHPALDRLRRAGYELVFSSAGRQPDESELLRFLPDCIGYLAGVEKISRRVLEGAPKLRVISRNGTGVDNIDLPAAERRGVKVCRAEGANARGVAELTLALMLALVRSVPFSVARLKAGVWERREGTELEGRTLGLVGCGRVGRLVARFAFALDMKVVAYDPQQSLRPSDGFEYSSLEALWPRCDFISLHCPVPPDRSALISPEILDLIKRGAYLVNTARAELLDEHAVLAALDSGLLSGLATDVFREEPPRDTRLAGHARVIATPHIGGYTGESIARAVDVAVENLLAALEHGRKSSSA